VQVPAACSKAVDPEVVQTVGVVEVKLTGSPELAVATNETVVLALWSEVTGGIGAKEMV